MVAAALPAPALRVVSVNVIAAPAPVEVGAERLETCRSGPIRRKLIYFVLLVSTLSTTVLFTSATPSTK